MSSSVCGLECYAANKVELKHEAKGKWQQHAVVSLTRSVSISTRGFVCSVCSDTLKVELTDGTNVQLAYGPKVQLAHGTKPKPQQDSKGPKSKQEELELFKRVHVIIMADFCPTQRCKVQYQMRYFDSRRRVPRSRNLQ